MTIEVEELQDDLSREVWMFYFDSSRKRLRLSGWSRQERPTRRHGWRTTQFFNIYQRPQGCGLAPESIPESVKEKALKALVSGVGFSIMRKVQGDIPA